MDNVIYFVPILKEDAVLETSRETEERCVATQSSGCRKIKVSELTIVTEKCGESTYYAIKYLGEDGKSHIGYGSYNLDIVLQYIKDYFDLGENKRHLKITKAISYYKDQYYEEIGKGNEEQALKNLQLVHWLTELDTYRRRGESI
jgi:hypothetical protein